ncbi:hypothetical protein HMPREF9577_01501 [Cutibacterium acnes HL110PA3]|nr:hypothetical protein HMPREF9577_01501 [Cutibacterium acnes HL110PA3]
MRGVRRSWFKYFRERDRPYRSHWQKPAVVISPEPYAAGRT